MFQFLRRRQESDAERLVRLRDRKRRGWRGHLNAYASVNAGLFLIDMLTGAHLWFLFPLISWGMGFGIHSLNYFGWMRDNRHRIAEAELEVGGVTMPPALTHPAHPRPAAPLEPGWEELIKRARLLVEAAKETLKSKTLDGFDKKTLGSELDGALRDVELLAKGAQRVRVLLEEVSPGGAAALSGKIVELERRLQSADDARLTEVYMTNLNLLRAREQKVQQLDRELQRMLASAEGFVLSVENMRLDAARLDAGRMPQLTAGLSDPMRQLSREVDILREVERELEAI
ncbi:MAG: 2TM domain-containing protein [Myxococcales bacterium]|nr:2TM domain-containing protein [Myxococcales bacterium]